MRKIGKLLSGMRIFILMSMCFLGCDGSATHSGGPTTPSAYTINLSASHTVIRSGGSTVLRAVVYNSLGERASGVSIVFTSPTGVVSVGTATTDADGSATTTLTATQTTTIVATVENVSVEVGITVI